MKKAYHPLLLMAFVLFAVAAKADDGKSEPCLVQGYVMNAITKKPIQGVVVSAITPGNSSKEAITNADGFFYFAELPSQVNLQFGKKGYQLYRRSSIFVKEKSTLKITVEFLPDNMDEDVPDDSEYPLLRMLEMK